MRNYIYIIRNLPGILKRLESELQGKASASSVSALCASVNSLDRRLADRPTKADLTIVEGDLGARIEKLEAATTISRDDLRENIRANIAKAVAAVEAHKLDAEKTGGPNLKDVLAQARAAKLEISEVTPNWELVPGNPVKAFGKPKLPRKPRKPKGGGK